jgi:transcription elongation factor GreA
MITISGLEPKQYSITEAGLNELRQQLDDFKKRRTEITDEMKQISSQSTDTGALQDSAMVINQNQAIEMDGQIELLERIIGLADVIKKPKNQDTVALGSEVTMKLDNRHQTFQVVGIVEADPAENKISDESPLGQSLLGKKVGDLAEITTPTSTLTATIEKIN